MSPLVARVGRIFFLGLPFFSGVLCVLIGVVPFNVSDGFLVTPLFPLMAVFYWALTRPDLMGPLPVFLIGLLHDLATAGPPGFWALIFLVSYAFSVSQRVLFTGRFALGPWLGFSMTAFLAIFLAWIIASVFYNGPIAPLAFFIQLVSSIIFYPLFMRIFAFAEHRLVGGM